MYDVVIVGAGVVGCCTARELSRYSLKTVVIEKEHDVSCGASKANSGIVHAGYDAKVGTQKAKFNVLGQRMFDNLSNELDFPFRRNGSLVVEFDKEGYKILEILKAQGVTNGVNNISIISGDEARQLEPNLSDNIYAALLVPDGGIVCPYEMTIAFAENAASNGVEFMLNCAVTFIEKKEGVFLISTPGGIFRSKIVINAAGVYSDDINNFLSERKIKITPRRGEYCLYDKSEGELVNRTIFQLPTKMGKGVLVMPTTHGNLLLGPTSDDGINYKEDTSTTAEGLELVLKRAKLSLKWLPQGKIITSFSGIRAHLESGDFLIEEAEDVPGLINLCGIASPGLTAAPAIGMWAASIVNEILSPTPNKNFDPIRTKAKPFASMTKNGRTRAIKNDPNYGHIICRCESVSKAEIIGALRSPIKANSLDAIKRRTRAGMGRCQGGFCWMRLVDIIAEECKMDVTEVTKSGGDTRILLERNKSGMTHEKC